MPDLESLILLALIDFLLRTTAKGVERLIRIAFSRLKVLKNKKDQTTSQKQESTLSDVRTNL
jgi:hypothetical protein